MGIMRWTFYNRLKILYPNVRMTYGYITKNTRIMHNLPKEHYIDALCITGHPDVKRLGYYFYIKQVRRHNRQIYKSNTLKGGIRKLNQTERFVNGFQLFDKVKYNGGRYYIFGRRKTGYFDIRRLDRTKINKGSVNCKYLTLLEKRRCLLIEIRCAPPMTEVTGFRA